jgi:hypothetical protein
MMVEHGGSINLVGELIGDKQGLNRTYLCFRLLEQAKDEFDLDLSKPKKDFSLLLLAMGQGNIKQFLGLPKRTKDIDLNQPVPTEKLVNLRSLISWIFGEGKYLPVIRESRDITNFLSHVVMSAEAVSYLENTRDLLGAYDRSDGEEKMLLKYMMGANSKLETALGIAHRHRTFEVVTQAEKCEQTVKALLKIVRD